MTPLRQIPLFVSQLTLSYTYVLHHKEEMQHSEGGWVLDLTHSYFVLVPQPCLWGRLFAYPSPRPSWWVWRWREPSLLIVPLRCSAGYHYRHSHREWRIKRVGTIGIVFLFWHSSWRSGAWTDARVGIG